MLVLTAMLRYRLDHAFVKQKLAYENRIPNPDVVLGKYNQNYLLDRYNNRRSVQTLAAKFGVIGRQARIVANAQTCFFCANLLTAIGIAWGGLDNQGTYTNARGDRPLTGWWNPINDTGYAHGTPAWNSNIPGL
jgi:hypothetical protein